MNREEAVQKYQEDVKEYLQNVSKRLKSGFAEGEKWFVKAVRKTVYQLYSTYEEKEKYVIFSCRFCVRGWTKISMRCWYRFTGKHTFWIRLPGCRKQTSVICLRL